MKKYMIVLVLFLLLTGCVPEAETSTPPEVRIYDRDTSQVILIDLFYTEVVNDVMDEVYQWQQSHPHAEILSVVASVGFRFVVITITYQEGKNAKSTAISHR